MGKYQKRTNNFHRGTTLRKEKKRPKATEHRLVELKSITIEFCTTEERDKFGSCLLEVLRKKGIAEFFSKCSQEGNAITISTKAAKPYKCESYGDLAMGMLDNMSSHDEFNIYYNPYAINFIKLYTRKGRQHLFLKVGIDERSDIPVWKRLRKYNFLSGAEEMHIVYSPENEFLDEAYDEMDEWW